MTRQFLPLKLWRFQHSFWRNIDTAQLYQSPRHDLTSPGPYRFSDGLLSCLLLPSFLATGAKKYKQSFSSPDCQSQTSVNSAGSLRSRWAIRKRTDQMTVKGQTRSRTQLSLMCAVQDSLRQMEGVTSTVVQHAASWGVEQQRHTSFRLSSLRLSPCVRMLHDLSLDSIP